VYNKIQGDKMYSFYSKEYKPEPGQLCRTFKGKNSVYSLCKDINCLISVPLEPDEIIMITKVVYHEELASYYVEFMRDGGMYYAYFYEQVMCFMEDSSYDKLVMLEEEERHTIFDYPWVICE
jgi:Tfp pilus assembly protein PilZ